MSYNTDRFFLTLKLYLNEKVLTEQSLGLNLGFLYIDTLIFENMIKVQEEYTQETRENLAIAKVRMQTGKCGTEEVLRWAGEVSEAEKRLLNMKKLLLTFQQNVLF